MNSKASALTILILAMAAAPASAALITGVTATASSFNTGGAGFPPERTVDESGLSGGVHSTSAGTSWLTPNINDVSNEWIQWDLGDSYVLDSIQVWNANQQTGFGTDSVDIYVSNVDSPGDPEGGGAANWTKLGGQTLNLPVADNTGGYSGFDLETATSTTLPTTGVRFVRFELNYSHASNGGTGNDSYTGIAEIQFDGTVVPEPSVALLGAFGLLALLRRRR